MNFLETENVVKQYAGHLALNKVTIIRSPHVRLDSA